MEDHIHLLQQHRKLLLENAQQILENPVYDCPVRATYFSNLSQSFSRSLHSLLTDWIKDIRYEGKRIYLLDNFKTFRGMFRTVRKISWITEEGAVQNFTFSSELEEKLSIYDHRHEEHSYNINASYDFLPYRRNGWKNTVYMPFPELIKELTGESKRVSKGIAKLQDEGISVIQQFLAERGVSTEEFTLSLFTHPDEESICLRIEIPRKEVKAHLLSDQPIINKSIMARKPVFEEVAATAGGHYQLVLDEKRYIYFFERHFSFDQLFYILQEEHLRELYHLVYTTNSAFWNGE